ncbi:protein WVD2-like 7 isoform X2 [Syzygium oleosum]|uniref:protein WVD2-like 7 isoform X2 n=1 Tax=Syzygium oleosum TaxID=219896 RepID=UPI0011D20C51|nr:protein WVD2-like 7 isoform X2 [Syzygium oleosum]
MGESACLRRSFSHPSDASREAAPGDPIRALTESVSFGRFMSESLAWEKWSTFSHNRYLEEVEKFSKPGSVAQKRAYFEAHYKKKAATQATSQIEEVGEPNSDVPRLEDIHTRGVESTGESESAKADTLDAHDENLKKDSVEAMLTSSGDKDESNPMNERSKLEIAEVASPENVKAELAEKLLSPSEDQSHFDNPEFTANSTASQKINVPDQAPVDQQILTSCEKKQALSSSKSSTQSRALRLPPPHAKAMTSMQPRGPRHVNNTVPNSQTQTVRSSVKEYRSSSKSLHMSINLASLGGSSTKMSSQQFLQVRKNEECNASPKIEKDNSIALKAQTRASLRKSVCSAIPASQDRSSKCASTNGSKARSTTVCSPFSFRSEERAAKRKEKQEEKNPVMKAEVQPLQTYKGKAQQDVRKLQHGFGFKAKKNDELCQGSQSPCPHSKCSLTRPQPSKLDGQPTPDKCQRSRPSQRIKINAESPNHVNRKISQSTTNHRTFLPQRNVQENASPNIQV